MSELVEVPKTLLERLLDRVDDLEAALSEYRQSNERDKATIRQDVHEAIEKAEAKPARDDETDESAPQDDSMVPMERMLRFGQEGVTIDVTASPRRAMSIAENISQWASKTPNGLVVKDNLKNLLQTATGERLAWRQVYRACEALERFTKGTIRFEKHRRHGWMLIAEPEIVTKFDRCRSSSASGG